MKISDFAKKYHKDMFGDYEYNFFDTDPEFTERFANFAFDEVINESKLDDKTRFIVIIATIIGCQGLDEFEVMVPAALSFGITPIELKEIVYQAVPYLGIARVFPFLRCINDIFEERKIKLPLDKQATTTMDDRLKEGNQAQIRTRRK